MKKTESIKVIKDIRNIASTLDKTKLFNREPEEINKILQVLSYAENFDSGYGLRLRNTWQDYKDKGLERQNLFNEFKEKIVLLALDIENYFKNSTGEEKEDKTGGMYIKKQIIGGFKKKKEPFNYKKLLVLFDELNQNYREKRTYSCLMLIRAIIDHIPPMLGYVSFNEIVNNYPLPQTDKAYAKNLLEAKKIVDDVLHRPISKSKDLLSFNDIPPKIFLNSILQLCLESKEKEIKKNKPELEVTKKSTTKKTVAPPIVEARRLSAGNVNGGYRVEIILTNKGKELAILKSLEITGVPPQDLTYMKTLSTGENAKVRVQLENTELRKGLIKEPHFAVIYKDIYENNYKSKYRINLGERDDKQYNFGSLTDFNFFEV